MTKAAHDIIAAKRAEIAAQERALEISKAELAGMERMANLLSSSPRAAVGAQAQTHAANEAAVVRHSSGRQPGAISQRWRKVLEHVVSYEGEWVPAEIFVPIIKQIEGRDTTAPQVRRILEGYATHGYVETNSVGHFRVTEMARQKFGFPPNFVATESNETGEASADLEAGNEGVAPPSFPEINP